MRHDIIEAPPLIEPLNSFKVEIRITYDYNK